MRAFPLESWVLAVAVSLAVVLGCANVRWGDVNQDEGWYLYAARLVAEGERPYRDFAFTQGPVFPFVYARFHPLVARDGVEAGRWCTFALGLAGCALAAAAAAVAVDDRRLAVATLVFALGAVNCAHSAHTAMVKTYALATVFLGLSALGLALGLRRPRGTVACVAAGVAAALAVGTRLSALGFVGGAALALLLARRRGAALAFCGGAVLGGLAVFLPAFLAGPERFAFNLVGYHTGREAGAWSGRLVYAAGFVSRVVQNGYPLFVAAGAAGLTLVARGGARALRPPPLEGALWLGVAGTSLLHATAPFPYDDYQAIVHPLTAAATGLALLRAVPAGRVPLVAAGVLAACALAAFSSPVNQSWFVRGRDRVWWRLKPESSLAALQRVGRDLRAAHPADAVLLTQDTYLAVEAGMRVPRGWELGPFSYYPGLDTATAERYRVSDAVRVRAAIGAGAPAAAVSGYGFAIASPGVTPVPEAERAEWLRALERQYRPVAVEPHFGQGFTELRLYERRAEAEEQP